MIIIGVKGEMTQTYKGEKVYPITRVDVTNNVIARIRKQADGQFVVTVGKGVKKNVGKQLAGMYKKLGYSPKYTRDVLVNKRELEGMGEADVVDVDDVLKNITEVVVQGVSKGKGFSGVVKRWGMKGGSRTRGQGITQRHQGSIGSQTPGRVWKGKRMAGRMGGNMCYQKNVQVIECKNGSLSLKGGLPGHKGTVLYITIR